MLRSRPHPHTQKRVLLIFMMIQAENCAVLGWVQPSRHQDLRWRVEPRLISPRDQLFLPKEQCPAQAFSIYSKPCINPTDGVIHLNLRTQFQPASSCKGALEYLALKSSVVFRPGPCHATPYSEKSPGPGDVPTWSLCSYPLSRLYYYDSRVP